MNSESTNQPVCIVTGGTSGIGRETVRLFAKNGYRIATCGRDPERLQEVRNELGDSETHIVEQVDLNQIDQAQQFTKQVVDTFGQVDLLVNNAAVSPLGPFDAITEETFEQTLNINVRSPFRITQSVWRQMTEQGRGVVVNISSLAAVDPFPGFSIYGASKAWLDLLTTALKTEGEEHNIRVYSVRAGAVETPMLRGLFPDFPADQCVSPADIANTILACVENKHESGSHIVVANQT